MQRPALNNEIDEPRTSNDAELSGVQRLMKGSHTHLSLALHQPLQPLGIECPRGKKGKKMVNSNASAAPRQQDQSSGAEPRPERHSWHGSSSAPSAAV